jgi:hypothetical protein
MSSSGPAYLQDITADSQVVMFESVSKNKIGDSLGPAAVCEVDDPVGEESLFRVFGTLLQSTHLGEPTRLLWHRQSSSSQRSYER